MEPRTIELRRSTAENRTIGLANRRRDRRASEGSRVQPLVHVMRAGVDVLSRNEQSVAAKTRSRLIDAVNGKRLTVLERENPVGFPASQYGVDSLLAVGEITLPGADRQFIGAAEMENLGDIEVAEAVISLNTESGEQRSAIGKRSFVQHVRGIRAAL